MLKHQVIIIGAGIAGLAAAVELIENGVNNILILEAQKRIGGRILSVPFDNGKSIELGPQWINNQDNKLYDLCSTINVLDSKIKGSDFDKKICYATQDGNIIDRDYVNRILYKIDRLFDEVADNASYNKDDATVLSEINQKFLKYFDKRITQGRFTLSEVPLINAIFESAVRKESIDMACDTLAKLSLLDWSVCDETSDEHMMGFKTGFWQLIEYFQSQIPFGKIYFSQEVSKIYWPTETPSDKDGENLSDQIITVITKNPETGQEMEFYADHCICTIPLGCLKEKHKEIFIPNLPTAKKLAIQRLGFSTVNKIFVIFEKPIFKDDLEGLKVLWNRDIKFDLKALQKWKLERPRFYESFDCFKLLPKTKHILYSIITGPDAVYLEQIKDECIVEVISEMLEVCFPKIKFPRVKGIIRSNWNSNQYSKGSHTYVKYGSSVRDVLELAKPINNKLFFAGEATSTRFSSAVGAYESGIRKAEIIVKFIEKRK